MESERDSLSLPWVLFRTGGMTFGLEATYVREMVPLPHVTPVPGTRPHVRGVFNLRGRVLPLLDTRILMKHVSLDEECRGLVALMQQREEDHRRWLNELEACVAENREFRLATDPHKCAFGKWYDIYTTDSSALHMLLMKFDAPHKAIHAVAHRAVGLLQDGHPEEAQALIERTRSNELKAMVHLFTEVRENIWTLYREIGIVIQQNGLAFALTADAVESAEPLKERSPLRSGAGDDFGQGLVTCVAKRHKDDSLVLLLDCNGLLDRVIA